MIKREVGRVTVLTNPASGHGNAPHTAETAIQRLQKRGIDVVAIVGSDAEHARRLLHAAVEKGTDALVVTVSAVERHGYGRSFSARSIFRSRLSQSSSP